MYNSLYIVWEVHGLLRLYLFRRLKIFKRLCIGAGRRFLFVGLNLGFVVFRRRCIIFLSSWPGFVLRQDHCIGMRWAHAGRAVCRAQKARQGKPDDYDTFEICQVFHKQPPIIPLVSKADKFQSHSA